MNDSISEGRKTAYYVGMTMQVVGGLLFGSCFLSFALHFGDFSPGVESAMKFAFLRAVLGMGLLIAGGFVRGVGARGLAGSGLVLDPEKTRQEMKPYSRMTGGMLKDTLEAAEIDWSGGKPQKVIMIKCQRCGQLNEEDSKFCQECGTRL